MKAADTGHLGKPYESLLHRCGDPFAVHDESTNAAQIAISPASRRCISKTSMFGWQTHVGLLQPGLTFLNSSG